MLSALQAWVGKKAMSICASEAMDERGSLARAYPIVQKFSEPPRRKWHDVLPAVDSGHKQAVKGVHALHFCGA